MRKRALESVFKVSKQNAAHHSGKAGDEFDAVLHLLLCDLNRRAVLLLLGKMIGAVLCHPHMKL